MGLREYQARRNFRSTREPRGKPRLKPRTGDFTFVVQKHDATRLHYDFRLEMNGVLKSWAVPKGFPTVRGDRRLAVQVEDHPLEYGGFEGIIPEGNYGAGTVMLWDRGTYRAYGDDPVGSLAAGKLHLVLNGTKLKGEWTLVRMKGAEGDKPQWLLLKSDEDVAPLPPEVEDRSVVSRRTLQEITASGDREWRSHRSEPPADSSGPAPRSRRILPRTRTPRRSRRKGKTNPMSGLLSGLPGEMPAFAEPMKACLSKQLPDGPGWVYEIKFDGVRALAIRNHAQVTLMSRNEKDFSPRFPELARALGKLPSDQFVLDGEIVAVDEAGRSSFQLLQSWHRAGGNPPPLLYYVFDVLNVDGRNVTSLELPQRKALLKQVLSGAPQMIRFSDSLTADAELLVPEMKSRGLEGLIAKRQNSRYEVGRRSGAWVKYKWTSEQEFVIGGYTRPRGGRQFFGALLVGYYEGTKLMFAAKVGTGFDEASLKALYRQFQPLATSECPFANLPEKIPGAFGRGLTAAQMRLCTWVKPKLVGQIRFSEWTRDHHLRQPSFVGLREDRNAREVVRERSS